MLKDNRTSEFEKYGKKEYIKLSKDNPVKRLQNAAQKIYFTQTEEEATAVDNSFADNSDDKKIGQRS